MKAGITGMILAFITAGSAAWAQQTSEMPYALPDTVKAASFIATVQMGGAGQAEAGISANGVRLSLRSLRRGRYELRMVFPAVGQWVTHSHKVRLNHFHHRFTWDFESGGQHTFKLLIASATDSAKKITIYSGYLFFPRLQQWKLAGTCSITHQWTTLNNLSGFVSLKDGGGPMPQVSEPWCRRSSGTWYSLLPSRAAPPVLMPFRNIDSVWWAKKEWHYLRGDNYNPAGNKSLAGEGIHYTILRKGSGKPLSITDTVQVFYKAWVFPAYTLFDETKEKPALFFNKGSAKALAAGIGQRQPGGQNQAPFFGRDILRYSYSLREHTAQLNAAV